MYAYAFEQSLGMNAMCVLSPRTMDAATTCPYVSRDRRGV